VAIEDKVQGPINILAHGHRRCSTKAKQILGSLAIKDTAHGQQAQALGKSRMWHIGPNHEEEKGRGEGVGVEGE